MKKYGILTALLVGAALLLMVSPVQADLIGFEAITNNSPVDPGFGEAQMFFEVGDQTPTVTFHFMNLGPEESSIEQIWFDDSAWNLFDTSSVTGFFTDNGVAFAGSVGDANFPGSEGYDWTTSFYYQAAPPPAHTGINPNEEIIFSLLLMPNYTYNSVMAALASGDLQVGIHVISWADGASESFINTPPPGDQVPEPATVGLLGLGVVAFAGFRWKNRSKMAG